MVLPTTVPLAFPQTEGLLLAVIMLESTVVSSLGLLKYGAGLTQGRKSPRLEEGKVVCPQEKRLGSQWCEGSRLSSMKSDRNQQSRNRRGGVGIEHGCLGPELMCCGIRSHAEGS